MADRRALRIAAVILVLAIGGRCSARQLSGSGDSSSPPPPPPPSSWSSSNSSPSPPPPPPASSSDSNTSPSPPPPPSSSSNWSPSPPPPPPPLSSDASRPDDWWSPSSGWNSSNSELLNALPRANSAVTDDEEGTLLGGSYTTNSSTTPNDIHALRAYKDLVNKYPCYKWSVLAFNNDGKFSGVQHATSSSFSSSDLFEGLPTCHSGSSSNGGGLAVKKSVSRNDIRGGSSTASLAIFWDQPNRGPPTDDQFKGLKEKATNCSSNNDGSKKGSSTDTKSVAECIDHNFKGRGTIVTLEDDKDIGYSKTTIGTTIAATKVDVEQGKKLVAVVLS